LRVFGSLWTGFKNVKIKRGHALGVYGHTLGMPWESLGMLWESLVILNSRHLVPRLAWMLSIFDVFIVSRDT